jgi:hypothetical protein
LANARPATWVNSPEPSEAKTVERSKHFLGPSRPLEARTDGDFSAVLSPLGKGCAPI